MGIIRIASIILLTGVLVTAHFALGKQPEWIGLFTLDDVLVYANRVLPNTKIPIRLPLTGAPAVDNYFAFMTAFFWGALDPRNYRAHLQANYLVGTLGSIWILMLVEAHRGRRSNSFLFLTYVLEIFGELLGIGLFTPIWCISHLLWVSPSTSRSALSTPNKGLGALGYAILLGHAVPTYLMIQCEPDGEGFASQQWWSVIRLFHPVLVFVLWQFFQTLQAIFSTKYPPAAGISENSHAGIRKFYIFSILISGWFHASSLGVLLAPYLLPGWLQTKVTAALDLRTFLVPIPFWNPDSAMYSATNPVPFDTGVAIFLQWDNICAMTAVVIWAASLFLEAAATRKTSDVGASLNVILQCSLVGLLAGPGAAAAYLLLEGDTTFQGVVYSEVGDKKLL